jgi:hypothetical protein
MAILICEINLFVCLFVCLFVYRTASRLRVKRMQFDEKSTPIGDKYQPKNLYRKTGPAV